MFIRATITSKKGKKYTQHHLVESIRTEAGPRQRLVLNLGVLDLPKEEWKTLANAIEDKILNKSSIFKQEAHIEKLAKHYSQVILENKMLEQKEQKQEIQKTSDYIEVDVNSMKYSNNKSIGNEQIIFQQMQEYECDTIFSSLSDLEKDYAKILISGRAIHPSSERETARWANEDSGIKELLNLKRNIHDNGLHRVAVKLWKNKEMIEGKFSQKAKEIFNLKENIILYDLTNTYFEGSMRDSEIAKPGRSKEKRTDRPIVTLALRTDEDGFAKKSEIYEGNVAEPKTLEDILNKLGDTVIKNHQKTIVIDAGIASEDNLELIKSKGFHYLAVSRKKTYAEDFWSKSNEKKVDLQKENAFLKVKLRKTDNESFLLCHSYDKEKKENAIFQKKLQKFEKEIQKLSENLQKKRARKKYSYILEKIGRLKERYGVSYVYDIKVQHENDVATSIIYTKNEKLVKKEKFTGKYVIRTDRTDLDEETISKIHRSLTTIESSFKSMKSHLGLRPNFHKKDICIKAHIFITVLAYHIISAIQKKLHDKEYCCSWETIRNILAGQIRVTGDFNTKNKGRMYIRDNTTLTAKQAEIFRLLDFTHRSLGTKRTSITSHVHG